VGRDRDVCIARTIRALDELVVEGVATTIPADLAILRHPDFVAVEHSTKWVEQNLDLSGVSPRRLPPRPRRRGRAARRAHDHGRGQRQALRREDVGARGRRRGRGVGQGQEEAAHSSGGGGAAGSGEVAVPMQGTIVKVLVEVGQEVTAGQGVVVLEAMKMENQINADKDGVVKEIKVAPGDTVGGGDVVVVIE
jgi:acetyl-CoA/propionyl-CoA carboxylase, biotin carboxylase, biotin carboxyl carrier protein